MVSRRLQQITRVPVGTEYLEFSLPASATAHSGYLLHLFRKGMVSAQMAIYPQVEGHPVCFVVDEDLTSHPGTYLALVKYADVTVYSTLLEVVDVPTVVEVTPIAGMPICRPLPVSPISTPAAPPSGSNNFGEASCL